MKVGILGTGDVGRALGRGFVALGHDVKMGSRNANNENTEGSSTRRFEALLLRTAGNAATRTAGALAA